MNANTVQLNAGTGFMPSLSDTIREYEKCGYAESLVPAYSHLTYRSGKFSIHPQDIILDKVIRFENASDPDDQAILYLISIQGKETKGLYVDSYGIYHDELSSAMLGVLSQKTTPHYLPIAASSASVSSAGVGISSRGRVAVSP